MEDAYRTATVQIPGSRAKIPLNPDEPLSSRSAKPTNRKLVRVRTQRVPLLSRDERKSKDSDEEDHEEENNDVATSAEAPPRLDGDGNGGKNGKERSPPEVWLVGCLVHWLVIGKRLIGGCLALLVFYVDDASYKL